MKRPSKKEKLCERIILLDNYGTYVANDFDIEAAKKYKGEDLDAMVSSGEFTKMVKKNTIEQLEARLNKRVVDFFSSNKLDGIKSFSEDYSNNKERHNKEMNEAKKELEEKTTAILNSMPIWENPNFKVYHEQNCQLQIYPTQEAYNRVNVSFFKFGNEKNQWEISINTDAKYVDITPDGTDEYNEQNIKVMEVMVYLYRHQEYLEQLQAIIQTYKDRKYAEIAYYETAEKDIVEKASDWLYKQALDLYSRKKEIYK